MVCEIYIFLRYIFRMITFGVAIYSNGNKFQKNTYEFPMDIFPTRIESCHIEIERLQMVVTSEVGERHVNDEEGS